VKNIIVALAITAAIALGGCVKVSSTPPTDLPDYVKIMPGSQQQFVAMDMGVMKGVVFQNASSPDDVLTFYRNQAQADGLPEAPTQSSNTDPAQKQETFADATAARMLVVSAKPQSGATQVTLVYRPVAAGSAAPAAPTNAAGS
jgi:hypothetical protein